MINTDFKILYDTITESINDNADFSSIIQHGEERGARSKALRQISDSLRDCSISDYFSDIVTIFKDKVPNPLSFFAIIYEDPRSMMGTPGAAKRSREVKQVTVNLNPTSSGLAYEDILFEFNLTMDEQKLNEAVVSALQEQLSDSNGNTVNAKDSAIAQIIIDEKSLRITIVPEKAVFHKK